MEIKCGRISVNRFLCVTANSIVIISFVEERCLIDICSSYMYYTSVIEEETLTQTTQELLDLESPDIQLTSVGT